MTQENKPNGLDKSDAPETQAERASDEKPQEPASELAIVDEGRLTIRIDLWRMPKAMARGILLNVDEIIVGWYTAQRQAKKEQQIVRPGVGVLQGIKQAGRSFKKLFQ